jgi:FkbM family methyltransferase
MIPVPRSIARIPILRGLFRVVLTSWARWTRGRYMVDERMGLRLLLDHDNIVDRGIFLTGTWEKEHLDTLFALMAEQRRHFDGEAVFLDIGAHWGLYALIAHKSGLFKRIVAVEPDPVNYAQLQANLFLNGAEHAVEALKVAASNRARTFGLYRRTEVNRGGTRVVEEVQGNEMTCHAVRLDDVLDFSGKLLVIKMDVESHEIEAIDGMLGLLSRNRCVIQLEIWDDPEEEGRRRLRHFEELFGRYGIKYVRSIVADHFYVSQPGG